MTISRIARIHLVYQFIILTLLVFAIGYNEILPYKKYLFLALIPVFCYQLMIVLCCTELLPLPNWMIVHENSDRNKDIEEQTNTGVSEPSQLVESPEPIYPKKFSSLKYTFKNREREAHQVNSRISETNTLQDKLKTTKSYNFPYHQKRSEERFDQKEINKAYKVRNIKSGNVSNNSKCISSPKSPSMQVRCGEQKSPISMEYQNRDEIDENDSPNLKKSYSFPFRQKKLETFKESDENLENDMNIPNMPPWKALNCSKSVKSYKGKRKSISTEALHEELELIKSTCQQKEKNDFSKSMELTGTLSLDEFAIKNPLKSTTSINKLKQGIVNCFNKAKRESIKTDERKQNAENRKRFFRELYLSKESLHFESAMKEESLKQFNNKKTENKSKIELFQPSYLSFACDSFSDDVKVFSHPKNFKT